MTENIKPALRLKVALDVVEIEFECGSVAKIDRCDLALFAAHLWYPCKGGGQAKYLKANVMIDGRHTTTCFHRLILQRGSEMEIDHINRDGLDNRRVNLRVVSHRQNQCNLSKRRGTTSEFHGINWDRSRGKWAAYCKRRDGRSKNLGRFSTAIEAARYRELFLDTNPDFAGNRNNL